MGELAVGTSTRRPGLRRRPRLWLAASLIAFAVVGGYVALAIVNQPLAGSGGELAERGVIQHGLNPGDTPDYRLFDYVDGGTFIVTKWVFNRGPLALTVTGVDPAPAYWVGLLGIKDARAAVGAIRGCCQIDEAATWSAPEFRPFRLEPGQTGAVSVRYLMSHCESNGFGAIQSFASVKVTFSVLGWPQTADIPYDAAVSVASPATCPRFGPARPSP